MNLSKVIFVAVVCAALGFGQAGQDQKPSGEKVAKADAKKPAAAAEKPEPGGKSEGIKVHGHWMLEVRNPDGTLASRKEFENGLVPGGVGGGALLTNILLGGVTAGNWFVQLQYGTSSNPNCTQPCTVLIIAPSAQECSVISLAGQSCTTSLTSVAGGGGTQIILQGTSSPAPFNGTVVSVSSGMTTCANQTTPPACVGLNTLSYQAQSFTYATPNTSVQAGQTVTVTVTFSFS
jgi:hypothetical protein